MHRLTAGLGDIVASRQAGDTLVAHALGSCVGIVARARDTGVCALVHVVVPTPPPPDRGVGKPGYYAPTAVATLLDAMKRLDAGRFEVLLIGGANAVDQLTGFDTGRRNVLAVRRALWQSGIVPVAEDVAGDWSRSVTVDVTSGSVSVHNPQRGTWRVDA